jgi:hypothetical protein
MKAWKRHMVVLAAWIFLFPVLYQPVHIIQHHSPERSDHSCDHHHHHHHKETADDAIRITQTENDCLICEYEFVIKDLPGSYELVNAPIQYYEVKTAPAVSSEEGRFFSQINPRAPPQS